jgi:multisubunit Na+/H+ antiporter MnhB subunit
MEEKKLLNPLLVGVMISLILIVFSIALSFTGGSDPKGGWISYLIIIIGLVIFIKRYGDAKNNEVTFGELFSYGFKATTMIVLIFVAFLFVLSFVTPEIKQKVLEATQLELEKQKNVTDEQVKTLTDGVNKYFWVILIGTTMFFFVLIGCIGSLLGAAITKKQPKNPFEQTNN